jgi:hypothetical protein
MYLTLKLSLAIAAVSGIAPLVASLGQKQVISFTDVDNAFQLAGGSISTPQILVSSSDYWGVIRAAGDLAKDFGRVTGTNFTLSNGEADATPDTYEYRPTTSNYTVVGDRHYRPRLRPTPLLPSPGDVTLVSD